MRAFILVKGYEMKIRYSVGVLTPAGWRQASIDARSDRVSPGMCQVLEVLAIDGESPAYGMSRTGAKRQQYNGMHVAKSEIGKRKRISSCEVLADS